VQVEHRLGRPLSPYAASALVAEIYAQTYARTHGVDCVGLRYFNVFGPRQDPRGAYAAVIPRWAEQLSSGRPCAVFGDGSASRDFCFVDNVVQANLLAACVPDAQTEQRLFNIAYGARTTLHELFDAIRERVSVFRPSAADKKLQAEPTRPGDIPHSLANIQLAREVLGYEPAHDLARGLDLTVPFYRKRTSLPSLATLPLEAVYSKQEAR
jgi:UDP-N-acetylglucosamine 4-epimerase